MNTKPNIGTLNALIRITLGFTFLAWSTAKLVKRPWRQSYVFIALLAAMKIAEGIVRFCPLTEICKNWIQQVNNQNNNQNNNGQKEQNNNQESSNQNNQNDSESSNSDQE